MQANTKRYRIISVTLLTIFLMGCAGLRFAAANAPVLFSNATITRDVAFGPAPTQRLDIYTPKRPNKDKRDVIVFFHGGSWTSGKKEDYRFVAETFGERGFVVVIPDYRKYPAVRFPVFVEDAAAAIVWVARHIGDYGGNPARIHVLGHSAGAHIGFLAVADNHYLAAYGLEADQIVTSLAGLAGPYDFTPASADTIAIFGPPARYPAMRVTSFIDGREPPMLLLQGDDDRLVGIENLERLQKTILAKHGRVEAKIYPGVDHMWLVGALSWLGYNKPDVADDVARFFRR